MMTCEQAQLLANLARLIKARKALDLGRHEAGPWSSRSPARRHSPTPHPRLHSARSVLVPRHFHRLLSPSAGPGVAPRRACGDL